MNGEKRREVILRGLFTVFQTNVNSVKQCDGEKRRRPSRRPGVVRRSDQRRRGQVPKCILCCDWLDRCRVGPGKAGRRGRWVFLGCVCCGHLQMYHAHDCLPRQGKWMSSWQSVDWNSLETAGATLWWFGRSHDILRCFGLDGCLVLGEKL